jgi:D-beta-D-heptose 7-phosphate kinase/D-beta-D-heptose 1-phosphate adenosyltransferase
MSDMKLSVDQVASYLQRLPSVRVWVLGDAMLDRYYWGKVDRISPEAPVPVVRVTHRSARLGGAANVAGNLRALGVDVKLFTVSGADRAGEVMRELLLEKGIDSRHVLTDESRGTTEKVRIIAQSQQVVRADFEMSDPVPAAYRETITSGLLDEVDDCDILIVSDYGKGLIQEEDLQAIIDCWRRKGKWILIDPHIGHFSWYRGAGVITPNQKEASSRYSDAMVNGDSLTDLGFRLKDELALDALLITRGEEGMSLFFEDRKEFHVPAAAKEVYDVTGAGDTVISVFGAMLGAGAGVVEAVIVANQAAGEAIKEVGAVTVNRDSILTCFK